MIRIRKHRVIIDGEDRDIILIRDFSDSIANQKILLTQKEDVAYFELVHKEID